MENADVTTWVGWRASAFSSVDVVGSSDGEISGQFRACSASGISDVGFRDGDVSAVGARGRGAAGRCWSRSSDDEAERREGHPDRHEDHGLVGYPHHLSVIVP